MEFVQAVSFDKKRPDIPEEIGNYGKLIELSWSQSPKDRPDAAEIVQSIISGQTAFPCTLR